MDARLPATFTSAEAAEEGVTRRGMQRMLSDGLIERVGHGLYRRTDAEPTDYDLAEIAAKARRATLCLLSALARHELTDGIPSEHDVALPRGTWPPRLSVPVRWHLFAPATFDVGREELPVDEAHALGVYNAPRSIVDAYRLRTELGPDIAHEALRRWLRRGGQASELMTITSSFPAARPAILNALQVLLRDT